MFKKKMYISFDKYVYKDEWIMNEIKNEIHYGHIEIGSNVIRVFYGESLRSLEKEEIIKVCEILKKYAIPHFKEKF